MNTASLQADLNTILNISFFRKYQTVPQKGLVCTHWIDIPAHSELPAIYHHVKTGDQLALHTAGKNMSAPHVGVFFKGFFIGEIKGNTAIAITELMESGQRLSTVITGIEKEKFLPIQNIQVSISKK